MASEWCDLENPMLEYYDSDFPSATLAKYPENFDAITEYQGLARDVERYLALAASAGPILEACCGTGRVAIPLAKEGHDVVGVDFSPVLLRRLEQNAARAQANVRAVQGDVTTLQDERKDYGLAIFAFNSLLCIPDLAAQRHALARIHAHLRPGGLLALDCVNPLVLPLTGDPVPKPFFTRRHPDTGHRYTRFAMLGPLDERQVQKLHGWYDQLDAQGNIRRRHYATYWRPIFRYELELLLASTGFEVLRVEGGHRQEPFVATSPRMFVLARR